MKQILDSIYNEPESWVLGEFCFVHKSGLQIWTSNGYWFYGPYNKGDEWSLIEKLRFMIAFKWWMNNAPIETLARYRHET